MNSFDVTSAIGYAGIRAIEAALAREYSGEVLMVSGEGFQRKGGDLIVAQRNGSARRIEVKTEETQTGNIFLEDWSDYLRTPGWAATLTSDTLAYYFLSTTNLFLFDWLKLQAWARGMAPLLCQRRRQSKYMQENRTVGYLVPLARLSGAVGYVRIRVSDGEREVVSAESRNASMRTLFGDAT